MKDLLRSVFLVVLFGLRFGCASVPCPTAGGAPCPEPAATCATACAKGVELGCVWATVPTPQGASCTDVCQNASQTVPWDVVSLSKATACP